MDKSRALPRSTDELRGLRAARWVRESRPGQLDNSGPASQRFEQDESIERLGLVDTGIAWEAGHSGWKDSAIATSEKWADMLSRAGTDYDVLVVAYVSRFCRNVDIGTSIRRTFHDAGVTIYFCDERILLSDESDWKRWIDLLVEAEHYSRNLQRTMQRTYKTKFRTHTDPGGMAPLGFRRSGGTPSVLEIDPDTIGLAVNLFERFALGTVSTERLAVETGLHVERIKPLLRNRIYNGWVQRYGEWQPAAWRHNPPVSDELWQTVADLRAAKSRGGGPRRTDRIDLLNGLLYCSCNQKLWSEGWQHGVQRKRHRMPCDAWGSTERLLASTWELPIRAQLAQLDLTPSTIAAVVQATQSPPPMPDEIGRRRIERERRALAERYGRGELSEVELVAEGQRLAAQLKSLEAAPVASGVTSEQAIGYLRDFAATWAATDGEREQADLVHAIYQRINVEGRAFAGIELTPEAEAHGLAIALPEGVRVGGEGLEPPTSSV